ncbi:SAM-dependent tRNA/rRNA cytosine-C5 methylase, partial [Candidatus Woesearchaeota archaeon]
EPEENEFVVDWALQNFDVSLVKVNTIGDKGVTYFKGKELNGEIRKCRRLWPNKTQTQGFFIAKFKK